MPAPFIYKAQDTVAKGSNKISIRMKKKENEERKQQKVKKWIERAPCKVIRVKNNKNFSRFFRKLNFRRNKRL